MKLFKRLALVTALLWMSVAHVSAADFASVTPSFMQLTLKPGEVVGAEVALTIHHLCVRSFEIDVVASNSNALVTNLTGVLQNGCGGATSTFQVEITGPETPQGFDLQFIDAQFGGVLGVIAVSIDTVEPSPEPLLGVWARHHDIVFQVASNGCTTKDDFQIDVAESLPLQLRLTRLQEDRCRAYLPLGTPITFSYQELGLQPGDFIQVVNPLGPLVVP